MIKKTGELLAWLMLSTFSIKAQTAIEYEDSATKKAMNGDFEKAIVLYTKAIEINPKYGEAYHNRGLSFLSIENDTAALTDFSKAIELLSIKNIPAIEWSYANRGNILFRYQQYEYAAADFKQALQVNPSSYIIYNKLALCYVNLGDDSLAMNCYDSSLAINKNFEQTYYYKGAFYMKLKQDLKAIENFDKAIEIDSLYESAYFQRGLAKVEVELYREAINDFDKVISFSGEDATYYLARGLAYSFLFEFKKACEDFGQAKKFGEAEMADEYIGKFCQ
jgi:tetratricopeptide (TPR) repeat protein